MSVNRPRLLFLIVFAISATTTLAVYIGAAVSQPLFFGGHRWWSVIPLLISQSYLYGRLFKDSASFGPASFKNNEVGVPSFSDFLVLTIWCVAVLVCYAVV